MVRRWSYINQLNFSTNSQVFKVHTYSTDSIVNSIMYLRKDYPHSTQASRKRWARRKHTNNYLFLSNILINWANEYRFYKNYSRSRYFQFFFVTTYLALNLSFSERSSAEWLKTTSLVVGSSWPLKIPNYFKYRFHTLQFFNTSLYKNISWLYLSSPKSLTSSSEISKNISFLPFLKPHPSFNTPITSKDPTSFNQILLLQLVNRLVMGVLTTYYSLLIKLFLCEVI